MRRAPYPAYKPSGVEWLGDVPAHWQVIKLGYIAKLKSGESITAEEISDSGDYPIFGGNGVRGYSSEYTHEGHYALIGRQGALCGNINYARGRFWASEHAVVVSPTCEISTTWLGELLRAMNLNQYSISAAQPGLSVETISALKIPYAPLIEQQAIAGFLDRETAKLDDLIGKKRTLIDALQEKRSALISRTVTRGLPPAAALAAGLDPHPPMKPSGIDWLGEVPAHWEIERLSTLSTKITNGYVGPTRDILMDEGIRYLQSLHIKENQIRFDTPYFVSEEWSNEHGKSILEKGDVLIVQTGDIGQVAVVTEEFVGCNCHALIIVAPQRAIIEGEWIAWVLNSNYGLHTLLSIQTGALHPHLNCSEVKDVFIPRPPVEEQRAITKYICIETEKSDRMIATIKVAIEKLQEYRAALITAAVTGKIDVRNAA